MTLKELFQSIADTIRMRNPYAESKIKATDFPSAIDTACSESEILGYNGGLAEGCAQGRQEQYDEFWDTVQNYGKPTYYEYRFFAFPSELYNPKYDFIFDAYNSYSSNSTFRTIKSPDLKKNCDFTALTAVGMYYTFYYATNLVNARTLKINENIKFVRAFDNCTNLEEVRFDGIIGQNGLGFPHSTKLSVESLRSILTALSKDPTQASGKTVTFNTASRAVIEADSECSTQLASAVAAGWTVAYNS